MLTKEYRIPLPLTVDEYRIAQLYMIAKKSREESHGEGSGVEIIVNEPYGDGPGGNGQYTHKIYHVGSHLPAWLKSLLPKDALTVQEEAWNAYPYTRTRYTCPFVEKFSLDIETYYFNDDGHQENVFSLKGEDLKNRVVDLIDVVKDQLYGADYNPAEDPTLYKSNKTNRGPLTENWLQEYWNICKNQSTPTEDGKAIMCAYKLCRVEFKYWGMQSKIEKFIHDIALRKTMLRAHRQAWAWMDEWWGLSMDDIRDFERQTMVALAKTMRGEEIAENEPASTPEIESLQEEHEDRSSQPPTPPYIETINDTQEEQSSSEDEFFDCQNSTHESSQMVKWSSLELLGTEDDESPSESPGPSKANEDSIFAPRFMERRVSRRNPKDRGVRSHLVLQGCKSASPVLSASPTHQSSVPIHLILVFHAGTVLDGCVDASSRQSDIATFRASLDTVARQHYSSACGRLAVRLIPCPQPAASALAVISSLSTVPGDPGSVQQKIPIGALPVLAVQTPSYIECVRNTVIAANNVYREFRQTSVNFDGSVEIVADCMGSVLAYDAISGLKTEERLEFSVNNLFLLGSPLGLVLASRKLCGSKPNDISKPTSSQVFNLFHTTDPLAVRLEPIISARFTSTAPFGVPRYQKFPLGDGKPYHLLEFLQSHADQLGEENGDISHNGKLDLQIVSSLTRRWWGVKRLDYALYCPDGLGSFPSEALPHLFHASYWESYDLAAFILRQICRGEVNSSDDGGQSDGVFTPTDPCEKWLRKRTSVKLKNVGANHRGNDIILKEGMPQIVTARFMYGPLDFALTGEKVDVYIRICTAGGDLGEWAHMASEITDRSGRLQYTIPPNKSLGPGIHQVKFVVRGDHTSTGLSLCILPPKTQAAVFSIDGAFTASVSVTGKDPKVRAGAVDVARHWQELGYLIIYITARPDMQLRRVVAWLAQHNFPNGLVSFADGLSTDPLRHKAEYLKHLVQEVGLEIRVAYGSKKDIGIYASVGLRPEQIFVVGRPPKKNLTEATAISEGYAAHLATLNFPGLCLPANNNSGLMIPRGCLSLPGQDCLVRRRSVR
ncbi:protein retinal degeneration B-like isoform X2 [Artemia franciscana]|uniref:DDHD domain-containing protein n=1 Tax=Artemia franciscana TaxID=6661 RepID=A0AA88HMZ4_ARTSF|nr:hypothetical protein QYM36_014198 [Artemia franciscana]